MFNNIKSLNVIFIFFIISIKLINTYIIFPFKLTKLELNITYDDSPNFVTKFLSQLDKNRIYTKLPIGEPKKEVAMFLTMEDSYIGILKDFCLKGVESTYNPYLSKTFKIDKNESFTISDLYNAKKGNDTISFYKDSNLQKNLEIFFEFIVANKTPYYYDDYILDSYCGKIGLLKKYTYPSPYANFIDYSKKIKNIIDSYQWGIFFFDKEKSYNIDEEIQNKYDGFAIIGLNENDYLNIFKTKEITSVYQLMSKTTGIGGKFDSIYFYANNAIFDHSELNFVINVDHNYIVCNKEYYNNIKKQYFNKYLDNKICQERFSSLMYMANQYLIVCDLSIKEDLNNFPNLYLNYKQLNFTFNLDYKDLFFEFNDKIYFLVIYKDSFNTIWNFGSLLIKKYPFMFDQDRKTLYFIKLKKYENYPIQPDKEKTDNTTNPSDKDISKEESKENKESFWNKYKFYILLGCLFIFLIVGAILGYIFGRKVWEKHRKARANELEDNFEYTDENDEGKFTKIIN